MATINMMICKKNKCSQFQKFEISGIMKYLCFYIDILPLQFEARKKYEKQKVPGNCQFKDEH